jgi:fructosamine-3-kinase
MSSEIIFNNEPKLSEYEADSKSNIRRIELLPHVRDFIAIHPRFLNKKIFVTFAHEGISSLVSIIETPDEKLVLKIPLNILRSLDEGDFLKVWEKAGVKVPHVFEEGLLNGHNYILMEYIDAPILGKVYNNKELIENKIYLEMGSILSAMHKPKAEGYGRLINGKAEFTNFQDWFESVNIKKRLNYVHENLLLEEEHGSLPTAFKILLDYFNGKKSSYCHFDFVPFNIFNTNPITVFDPNPEFNNGYVDLGRSVVIRIAYDNMFPQQLVDGYFAGETYSKKLLHASLLLNSYMKFPYWHKVKRLKQIKNVQDYLIQNKHILES